MPCYRVQSPSRMCVCRGGALMFSEPRKRLSCSILYRQLASANLQFSPYGAICLGDSTQLCRELPFILVILLAGSPLKLVVSNIVKYHNAEFRDLNWYGLGVLSLEVYHLKTERATFSWLHALSKENAL